MLAAGQRLGGLAMDLLANRLELCGLELRQAKIRFLQFVLLACCGAALLVAGLALALVAVLLALPPQWRLPFAGLAAVLCLVSGALALGSLRRRLAKVPLAFSRTAATDDKDRACF